MKRNCPNCGAPITFIKCPYCGTTVFDFAAIDDNTPTYIRMKVNNDILTFKAFMPSVSIDMSVDDLPEINAVFRPLAMNNKGMMMYIEKGEAIR